MKSIVDEVIENTISFLNKGNGNPIYKHYSDITKGFIISDYIKFYRETDLYGRIVISIIFLDNFNGIELNETEVTEFVTSCGDVPHFINIFEFLDSLNDSSNPNIEEANRIGRIILMDLIRESVIDEILS